MKKFITYLSLGLNLGMIMFMSQNFQMKAPKVNKDIAKVQFQEVDNKKVSVQAQLVYYRAKQAVNLFKLDNKVKSLFLKVEPSDIQQSKLMSCDLTQDGAAILIMVDPKTAQDINNRESEKIIMQSVFECLTKKIEFI